MVFGDSWARGSELGPDEKTFGELLAEHLGCDTFANYSHPASSISHLIVQLKNFLKMVQDTGKDPSEYLAVFFLTSQHRSMSYLNERWIFQTPHGGFGEFDHDRESVELIDKLYYKYFHSPELVDVSLNTTLISLQSMCRQYNIVDFYVPGWEKFNLWKEVDSTKVHSVSCGDVINFNPVTLSTNEYIYPNQDHPNQLGHQKIAEFLYHWIVTCA